MTKKIISLVLVLATLFSIGAISFTADGAVLQRPRENPSALRNKAIAEAKSIPNTNCITVPSCTFADVPNSRWSHKSISAAVAFNLMIGTDATHFNPAETATVGEFNAVIKRLKNGKVTANDYAADSTELTRQYAVYTAWLEVMRWTDPGADIPARFTDQDQIPSWARKAWAYCISQGIINGTSNTTLEPLSYMTKEQLATFAVNIYLGYYGKADIKNFNIVEGTPKVALVNDTTGLNLRAEADVSDAYNVRLTMSYNDSVIVYGVYTSGIRWAIVKHVKSGLVGFCAANLLRDCTTQKAYVNDKTGLNLRSEPNMSNQNNVISLMPYNDEVTVYAVVKTDTDWAIVKHVKSGIIGYCANKLLRYPKPPIIYYSPNPIYVGDTVTFTSNEVCSWSSSNTNVIKFNDTYGKTVTAKAVSAGTATVKAVSAATGLESSVNVTVNKKSAIIPPEMIIIEPPLLRMRVGQTKYLWAKIFPTNATNQNVTWWTDAPSVVTLSDKMTSKGEALGVKGRAKGCAKVWGMTCNKLEAYSDVEVNPMYFTVTPTSKSIHVGERVTIRSSDISTVKSWKITSGYKYIKIVETGSTYCVVEGIRVEGIRERGSATVTATAFDRATASCKVYVLPNNEYIMSIEPKRSICIDTVKAFTK